MTDAVEIQAVHNGVLVRGRDLAWVEARLRDAPIGRRRLEPISRDAILVVLEELADHELELTQVDLAASLGASRTRTRDAVAEHFGSWESLQRHFRHMAPVRWDP